jgi:hypothetical protein
MSAIWPYGTCRLYLTYASVGTASGFHGHLMKDWPASNCQSLETRYYRMSAASAGLLAPISASAAGSVSRISIEIAGL